MSKKLLNAQKTKDVEEFLSKYNPIDEEVEIENPFTGYCKKVSHKISIAISFIYDHGMYALQPETFNAKELGFEDYKTFETLYNKLRYWVFDQDREIYNKFID